VLTLELNVQIDADADDTESSQARAATDSSANANPSGGIDDHESDAVEFVKIFDLLNSQPSNNFGTDDIVLPTHL